MPRVSHATKAAAKAAQFASPYALGVIQAILLNLQKPLLAPKTPYNDEQGQRCASTSPEPTAMGT